MESLISPILQEGDEHPDGHHYLDLTRFTLPERLRLLRCLTGPNSLETAAGKESWLAAAQVTSTAEERRYCSITSMQSTNK